MARLFQSIGTCWGLCFGALQAQSDSGLSPLRLYWPQEAALLGFGLVGDLVGQSRLSALSPAGPNNLRQADLLPWDRFAAGWNNPVAARASDVAVAAVGGAMVYADAWNGNWGAAVEDGIILCEALAWSAALSLNVRALAVHPRPLVYGSDAPRSEREAPDAAGSFHSGHASAAFAGAAYLATVYPLRHPEFKHRAWLWGGGMAAASVVAGLRVAAGKHFPSDVIAAAAVGTLIGWIFPTLHRAASGEGGITGAVEIWPRSGGWACQTAFAISGHSDSGRRKVRSAEATSRGREK